ncbi:MAG: IS30 family transposase [Gammaproteobacteria bacterium]|uniref:IS30 family transposase n=1 Tax=Candidatus Kutchimonas denitrificans TaxID=3056748 RepID=A0AAE4ZAV6_9BACT|nr:IS30 family transposase [Candidatus Kutchimonas denitrificans]NIR84726.1 IS30 family transposase [Gammaproteobacteria bacterium]
MGTRYNHLTLEERCRLRGMMEMELGVSEIARRLGRHRGTIHREIARNRCADGYQPDSAARRAWARKLRGSRIGRSTRLRALIEDRLAMGWSPEQIAGRMELEGEEHRTSPESIYRHVYSPAGRRAGLPRQLAQHKARRGRRRRTGAREPAIPNRTPIHQRPTKAHLRSEFGHWEGDLVHFRRRRDILLTLQERRSRLTLARRLLSKDAGLTASAIAAELRGLAPQARRTITYDNGGEFARHETVTERIGLRAYFCDPHSPWQRGGIENAHGRLRRELPRKTSLADYTDADIDDVIWNLNSTPRKCLGYRTPIEAFAANLGVALEM